MSLPLPSYDPVSRANWLGRYLAVERNFDKQLNSVLKDSLSGIDEAFAKHNRNFSDQVRRVQLSQSRRALRDVIGSIFGSTGNLIRNNRQDAAVAAIDAGLFDERSILARIFTNPVARKAYAQSLRQSGRRNIESVMTRVLETEIPLSKRVYKSQALANGMVSRTINRALARGDSFKDLARDVTALIDPAVPGGVSYAARRLGRTEINNAFHAQSIHDAQEHPWIQEMEWHLSKVHVTDPGDECELYAIQKDFSVERVPVKPHPHCRCYVTPKLPDYDQFETALVSGQYDDYLNRVLGFDEDSAAIIDMGGLGTKAGPDYSATPISTKVVGVDSGTWQDAPNHTALVYRFEQKWMGDPLLSTDNLQLVNFTPENVALEDAKRMLAAIDDKLTKYPQAQGNLKQIVLGWGEDSEYARTIREADNRSTIKFNLSWAKDSDEFHAHLKSNVYQRFHPANTDIDPYYDMMTHEFGHVLDNVGMREAQNNVSFDVADFYRRNVKALPKMPSPKDFPDTPEGYDEFRKASAAFDQEQKKWQYDYHRWLLGDSDAIVFDGNAPSRYSVNYTFQDVNEQEALAEAFLDVERNGKDAKPLSKLLSNKLIQSSKHKPTDVDEIMRLLEPQPFGASSTAMTKTEQAAQAAKQKAIDYFDSVGTKLNFFYEDDVYPPTTFNQLINAHKKLHDQFPEVNIEMVTLDDLDTGTIGQTFGSFPRADRPQDDQTITSEIIIDRYNTKHVDMWKFWAQRDEEKGWHPPGSGTSPVASTYTHEFGHAFLNALGENVDSVTNFNSTMDDLREAYTAEAGSFNPTKFNKWLREGLSGYSFETQKAMQKGIPLMREAYPEAFDAVQRLGNKASEPAKILYNRMIDSFNAIYRPEGHSVRTRVVSEIAAAPKQKVGAKVVDIIDVLAGDKTPETFDNFGSVEDIAHVLNDFFCIQMDFEGDFPYAWTDETTSLEAMKALGNQYLSLHKDFPHIDIQRLDNVDMIDGGIIATTYPNLTGSYMEWNRLFLQNPQILAESAKQSPDFHPAGDDENPIGHSFTHEFGHAIVNFTNSYLPDNLTFMDIHGQLFDAYKAELETAGKKDTPTGFRRWMHKNLSGYSFEIDPYTQKITDVLEPDEAMAEAFGDVYMNGKDKALKGSRVIYDYMMKWHDAALKDRDKRHKARINVLRKQVEGKGK